MGTEERKLRSMKDMRFAVERVGVQLVKIVVWLWMTRMSGLEREGYDDEVSMEVFVVELVFALAFLLLFLPVDLIVVAVVVAGPAFADASDALGLSLVALDADDLIVGAVMVAVVPDDVSLFLSLPCLALSVVVADLGVAAVPLSVAGPAPERSAAVVLSRVM